MLRYILELNSPELIPLSYLVQRFEDAIRQYRLGVNINKDAHSSVLLGD